MPGFPLRHWSIKIMLVNAETKTDVPADIFSNVTYNLHESFGDKAKQVLTTPPFRVSEDGWGEFELSITFTDLSGKAHTIIHDLNFAESRYEIKHVIVFKNPKPPLLASLRASGPIPGEPSTGTVNGERKRESGVGGGVEKKKKKGGDGKGVDMDKLAEGLQKLGEDDLLQVVQMVHDNKNEESWMRNDVERKCSNSSIFGHGVILTIIWMQRANSTWICTLYRTVLSRCCGTLRANGVPSRQRHEMGSLKKQCSQKMPVSKQSSK